MIENLDFKLEFNRPIKFYNVCKIHQIPILELLDMDDRDLDQILFPFAITKDILEGVPDEAKSEISNLDIILHYPEFMNMLYNSLFHVCKIKPNFQQIHEGIITFNGFEGYLDKNNFDEFADIVLKICAREKVKKEKPREFKNDEQREIQRLLDEGRKRAASKNQVKLSDVMRICSYGGSSYIPSREIEEWSLCKLMNAYKAIVGVKNYDDSFKIYLVSGEKSLIENKHWTDLIKSDYKYSE